MQTPALDAAEYERRRVFTETVKEFGRAEHIEIARILRKHEVTYSENRSGIFFDLTKVSDDVFADLLRLHEFIKQNELELSQRSLRVASR